MFIPILYMLIFPLLLPYVIMGGYDVIFYLVFGTISTLIIIIVPTTIEPPVKMIKNADGKKVKRCWKCTALSIHLLQLTIMSLISFGILYWMFFADLIMNIDMIYVTATLSITCSLYVYVAIIREKYPETAKECSHLT